MFHICNIYTKVLSTNHITIISLRPMVYASCIVEVKYIIRQDKMKKSGKNRRNILNYLTLKRSSLLSKFHVL